MTVSLSGLNWRVTFQPTGGIGRMDVRLHDVWKTIPFRSDEYAGPRWYGEWDNAERLVAPLPSASGLRETCQDGLRFGLEYLAIDGTLAVEATLRNERPEPFRPVKAGLRLGLDTYMEKYPDWNGNLFPTLLRCEKTHFWGYGMSPEGTILGIASPDPIASWSLDYNRADYGDWGHRIFTANLDLLNALPLPSRHPQHLHELNPGEERTWTIFLSPVDELNQVPTALAPLCRAPILSMDRLTLEPGETVRVSVASPQPVRYTPPVTEGRWCVDGPCGARTLAAETPENRRSEATVYVRRPWSWYMHQARLESLRVPQKPYTHTETWLGLYSQFLGRLHFPDAELDRQAEERFWPLFHAMFDADRKTPRYAVTRIQNTAYMAGLFAARYRGSRDLADLEIAAGLSDYVLRFQCPTGALMGDAGAGQANVHYSCVCYPLKSILEVCLLEKGLAAKSPTWRERYERHWACIRAAMDDLVRQKDNIETEGEMTFEDGMISCSAAQLGFSALHMDDPAARAPYVEAARELLNRHRCLEQVLIPDCRMNGCTLRFWESQYDVLLYPNMINSPHGWTSWKTYATYYLYLLTGEEHYLQDTMNTLGACVQVMDSETGRLRWGFIPDPYVRADQLGERTHWFVDGSRKRVFIEDPSRPGCKEGIRCVIGEQYVDMISHFYDGWCCDNDVHEHFKCLEEVALTHAFVVEHADGEWASWNCRTELQNGRLHITPSEPVVDSVHFNAVRPSDVVVHFAGGKRAASLATGLQWVCS